MKASQENTVSGNSWETHYKTTALLSAFVGQGIPQKHQA